jgi:RNA polymerase sigma-70 factor (ECF subfamily)
MDRFETTQWGVILATANGWTLEGEEALNRLCRLYWHPLYAFVRGMGYRHHDAEDLTQQFLAEMLGRDGLAGLSPERGRFRSFLKASLRNFLSHARERAATLKRGGETTLVPLESVVEPVAGDGGAEAEFDQNWALAVLDRARVRLAGDYASAGRSDVFELMGLHLPGGEGGMNQGDLAVRLGMSVGAVKTEIWRMRQRFGQYVRMEVAETVADPEQVDDEIRYLVNQFRNGGEARKAEVA